MSDKDDEIKKDDDTTGNESDELSEQEMMAQIQEQMAKTPVKDFVAQFMMTLSSLAWQRMGVYQDPDSQTVDFDQAKLAIDCYGSLAENIRDSLDDETKQAIDGVLSSLRMTYIEKNK